MKKAYRVSKNEIIKEHKRTIMAYLEGTSVHIDVPEGQKHISSYAFSNMSKLESISIPTSVVIIDVHAIDNCSKLTSIYYKGTQSEWNSILKDTSLFTNLTIYYEGENV